MFEIFLKTSRISSSSSIFIAFRHIFTVDFQSLADFTLTHFVSYHSILHFSLWFFCWHCSCNLNNRYFGSISVVDFIFCVTQPQERRKKKLSVRCASISLVSAMKHSTETPKNWLSNKFSSIFCNFLIAFFNFNLVYSVQTTTINWNAFHFISENKRKLVS